MFDLMPIEDRKTMCSCGKHIAKYEVKGEKICNICAFFMIFDEGNKQETEG